MFTALAPMDGYTDSAFREIVKKYGKPDMLFTEFVNAEGLLRATEKKIEILRYTEFQRPVIAQLFGSKPENFYHASIIALKLGFDGIDINMGCTARNIVSNDCGAALIKSPELACKVIEAVKKARSDYVNDAMGKYENVEMSECMNVQMSKYANVRNGEKGHAMKGRDRRRDKTIATIKRLIDARIGHWGLKVKKNRNITVSVKTRMGYDKDITEEWIGKLSETEPDFITLHGRTFKQRFKGKADWEAIRRAASVTDIPIIGNGDVKNMKQAQTLLKQTGCWGVMIGRGAFGKPWIFCDKVEAVSDKQLAVVALEHARLYVKFKGEKRFHEMRKHLIPYFQGFRGAKDIRKRLSKVSSLDEVEEILRELVK